MLLTPLRAARHLWLCYEKAVGNTQSARSINTLGEVFVALQQQQTPSESTPFLYHPQSGVARGSTYDCNGREMDSR